MFSDKEDLKKYTTILLHAFMHTGDVQVSKLIREYISEIVKDSEKSKAVLTVLITSLVKKIEDPHQDVRIHQTSLNKGYSRRSLDTKVITPFLKEHSFPAMAESGWLTRSLEHAEPYVLTYKGSITPKNIKNAFLQILNAVENNQLHVEDTLAYIFTLLKEERDKKRTLQLYKPTGKTIADVIGYIQKHFSGKDKGVARLPELAIYAVYQQMVTELRKYKNCTLCPLNYHNAPDEKTGYVGDIQLERDGIIFEAVEVKHGIVLDSTLVRTAYNKFKVMPIKTYYLLSTNETISDYQNITCEVLSIKNRHGCQVIVNGLLSSLKYYLRLLSDTDTFVHNYVVLVEKDSSLNFAVRQAWNDIVE